MVETQTHDDRSEDIDRQSFWLSVLPQVRAFREDHCCSLTITPFCKRIPEFSI